MKDSYGRTIDYMRISITDRCNLRCRYCMPDGISWLPMEEILTFEEIYEVCVLAAKLGIKKLKITGGEPLVRKGCTKLICMLKRIPGISQVTLTTNGVLLAGYAEALKASGIDGINVSLDTLDPVLYEKITGFDRLRQVLQGLEAAEEAQIPLKVNAVLGQGRQQQWQPLAELARNRALDVRFIEMMPVGYGAGYQPVSNTELLKNMEKSFGSMKADKRQHGNGPAVYYRPAGFKGSIGFISAVHGKFCQSCNRIRLTSTGKIKPCLCYGESISLREALWAGNRKEVSELLVKAVRQKPLQHCFEQKELMTETLGMSKIGG